MLFLCSSSEASTTGQNVDSSMTDYLLNTDNAVCLQTRMWAEEVDETEALHTVGHTQNVWEAAYWIM